MKIAQYRIYKLSTFDLFTEKENHEYDLIKKNPNRKLEELIPIIIKNTAQRIVRESALNPDNEIALFDGDLLRMVRNDDTQYSLIDDVVFIEVYHNEILEQILEHGFRSATGKEFVFFTASAAQTRNEVVTFISKEALEKNRSNIMCGLTEKRINESEYKGINLGKYLNYISLVMSLSIPIDIDIDRVIVVPDLSTQVVKEVEYIDTETLKSEIIKDMRVSIEQTDGAGMFIPGLLPSSCQIRGRWFKGAIFPFDFHRFTDEVTHNKVVVDVYNVPHNIEEENIQLILSASQFKMWKYYDDWNEYKDHFKANNLKFSITATANEPKAQTRLAYQFLQTLNMTDRNIKLLCADSIKKIKALHNDAEEMKKILGATVDNEHLKPLQEAILMCPDLLKDKHVQSQIEQTVVSYRQKAMAGRVLCDGFYSYICPDLYAYCQRLFEGTKEPLGLIGDGEVYNAYFNNSEVKQVDLLRSPHLSNEHCLRTLNKSELCKEWFIGNDTVVSIHDLSSKILMNDWDGDECLITSSNPIIESIRPTVPLVYEMFKATEQQINKKNIYDTLKRGFDSNCIGDISNALTKEWNTNEPDQEIIKILTCFNNFTIDYPKTGKNISLTSEMQEKFNSLKGKKNPYFFRYAKKKKEKNCQEINGSVVNRISQHIKSNTNNIEYKPLNKWVISTISKVEFKTRKELLLYKSLLERALKKKQSILKKRMESGCFNWAILTNDDTRYQVRRDTTRYGKLEQALFKYNNKIRYLKQRISKLKKDDDDFKTKFDIAYQYCKDEMLGIYSGRIYSLVNALVDIEYCQEYRKGKSKNILWNCFGDILVKNIKRNTKSDIAVRSRPRLAYSTKNKEKYAIVKKKLDLMAIPLAADITKKDMEKIDSFKPKNKNDRLIFYIVTCFCKAFEDNKLILSKSRKAKLNANKINAMAGTRTFSTAIKRLANNGLITVADDGKKTTIQLVDLNNDEIAFKVENVWRAMFYLDKHKGAAVATCEIDGNEFIKKGNTKTCSPRCQKELEKRNKKKTYEKTKNSIDLNLA